MTTPSIEAVVAGSKGFALALLAPITERVGTRPRVASDPSQALALCRNPGGLVVVEFVGEDSLRAIKDLVLQGNALRIVAAVSSAHAGAEEPLRALGVELARWDGKPEGVLGAVSRQLAAPSAAASAPLAASPSQARPAGAAVTPAPPPAAQPIRATPPPPPAFPPSATAPMAKPAAAAEAPGNGAPTLGSGLFDDLAGDDEFDVDVADGGAPSSAIAGPLGNASGIWPANVPDGATAAEALARGLAGLFDPPGTPLASVAEVVGGLSDLEQAVLAGEPQPLDAEPIRRAAVMRVRVAAALATAPAEGGAVDAGAVSAFLAEIDALLSEVGSLAASAPPELLPSLEAIRNSLVKEAIDFSEASQRGIPVEIVAAPAAPTRAVRETRVLSVASKAETELEVSQHKRQRRMVAALAVCAVLGAAFHGYNFWRGSTLQDERPTRSAVPNAIVVSGPTGRESSVIRSKNAVPFTPEEVKRLADEESLKGNSVREVAKGVVVIIPGAPAGSPSPPAPPVR